MNLPQRIADLITEDPDLFVEDEHRFKGSKFSNNAGDTFPVEKVLAFAKRGDYLNNKLPIDDIKHDMKWWEDDPEQTEKHMKQVDTSYPIIVIDTKGKLSVADGLNRMAKAIKIEKKTTLPAYVIPAADIEHLKE